MVRKRLVGGFSLIELMAAAAIMGIIVSIALPRYRLFVARGRMSEAKANLGIIATLQHSYYVEYLSDTLTMDAVGGGGTNCNTSSAGKDQNNKLGFRPSDCDSMRYFYTSAGYSSTSEANANATVGSNYREIYPGCTNAGSGRDTWQINNKKRKLTHTTDIIEHCYQ